MTLTALLKSDALEGSETPQFPTTKYGVIVADPPWKYTLRDRDTSHRGRTPYPQMNNQDILDLPVGAIAADSCYLFLWTTANHMDLAGECISKWGFTAKSIHTWVKVSRKGTPHIGIGHYGRNCTEFLRVATKGNPGTFIKHGDASTPTVMFARRGEHSAKPEEFWKVPDLIKNSMDVKGIELFARASRPGWECWGLEAPSICEVA